MDRLGDLHGQLARGHEDERRGLDGGAGIEAGRGAALGDALEQREREGGGLAGAGGRLAEQVAPLDQRGDGLALDGRRLLVAEAGERGDELGAEAEGGERRQLAEVTTNADGRTDGPILPQERFRTGCYELLFHVGAWLDAQGHQAPSPRFLDEVPIRFGMAQDDHYHVPLLISPYGFSTYRGS